MGIKMVTFKPVVLFSKRKERNNTKIKNTI